MNFTVVLAKSEGREWVEQCLEEHPEIVWLADEKVRKTEEGDATCPNIYSELMFGKKFIEFDRTLLSLHSLKLILDGSDHAYQRFSAAQESSVRLKVESFRELHAQGKGLLQSRWHGLSEIDMARAMTTALVLGDMGKSAQARQVFHTYGIHAPDHDDFFGEAMQILNHYPQLSPSFSQLNATAQTLLIKVANLAHYGHITHLEGGPAMFQHLKQSQIPRCDPIALEFDLFMHKPDIAGALGHVNSNSSLVYTESIHRTTQAMDEAVRLLSDLKKGEFDAYDAYLKTRATWLGLDPNDKVDRVLARMGAQLRLFDVEEGRILKKTIFKLDKNDYERILTQFDIETISPEERTPTYIPALLVNLLNHNHLGPSKEQRLSQAITIGFPFISQVLQQHRDRLKNHLANPLIPLNFNSVAKVAKMNPILLISNDFDIDQEGTVLLKGYSC